MKYFAAALVLLALVGFAAGCGTLDTGEASFGDRVAEGVISFHLAGTEPMPADAEVIVKVVDMSAGNGRGEVLGEQTIVNPSHSPIPFRIEYRAEDPVLRRGLNIDARISIGGKLAYYTANAHPITASNAKDMHVVELSPIGRSGRE